MIKNYFVIRLKIPLLLLDLDISKVIYHLILLQVWLDVGITNPSTYQFILRYTNPNPTPVEGKITMHAPNQAMSEGTEEGSGGGDDSGAPDSGAETVEHYVVLPATGGQVR